MSSNYSGNLMINQDDFPVFRIELTASEIFDRSYLPIIEHIIGLLTVGSCDVHKRTGLVFLRARGGWGMRSLVLIFFSIACPKIKWFCPNITYFCGRPTVMYRISRSFSNFSGSNSSFLTSMSSYRNAGMRKMPKAISSFFFQMCYWSTFNNSI